MTTSLPADPPAARSLTGVMPDLIASLGDVPRTLPPVTSAIALIIDGLGAANLAGRAGHARFLAPRMGKKDVARTVFPATTAAALTSLLTATSPGEHGIVGYAIRNPNRNAVVNQLRGWETDRLDPLTWQRSEPVFAREAREGRPCYVVTRKKYIGTGFTTATVRGAEIVGVDDLVDRVSTAAQLAAQHPGALIYLYAPELDEVGHRYGVESDEWSSTLEIVDAAVSRLEQAADARTGILVTADHGMVDIPAHRQILLSAGDQLLDGVQLIGGEPRMLHLYAEDGAAQALAAQWKSDESARSWVLTRDEAVASGIFGPVHPDVLSRIGDVVVAARAGIVYYDDRLTDKKSQKMVGQHGSLTPGERVVPFLKLGAYRG